MLVLIILFIAFVGVATGVYVVLKSRADRIKKEVDELARNVMCAITEQNRERMEQSYWEFKRYGQRFCHGEPMFDLHNYFLEKDREITEAYDRYDEDQT